MKKAHTARESQNLKKKKKKKGAYYFILLGSCHTFLQLRFEEAK